MMRKRSRKSGQVSKGTPEKWSQSQTANEDSKEKKRGLGGSNRAKRSNETQKKPQEGKDVSI